jgi:pimeloyl-ACP methyl ester carboxylesterase
MPTLLLLPGLMCDASVWAPQVQALSGQAQCVVPDWGLTNSLTAMAQQVLDQAPTTQFALAGHSMGGRVALEVLRLAPERVSRVALMDTGTHPLAAGEAGEKERAGRMALLAQAQTQGMRPMGRQWLRGMVHPQVLETPLFESMLDMIERSSPAQFAAQIQALLGRPDAAPQLAAIQCPTLVLTGRQDLWSPPEQHERIARAIPGAELVIIEDSAHMVMLEQPQAVNAALKTWLSQA